MKNSLNFVNTCLRVVDTRRCPSSLQVDTIACVHIASMTHHYTRVQTATAGRLLFVNKCHRFFRAICHPTSVQLLKSPLWHCPSNPATNNSEDQKMDTGIHYPIPLHPLRPIALKSPAEISQECTTQFAETRPFGRNYCLTPDAR
jgi:hypothetical protein